MPKRSIEYIAIDEIEPADRNPKRHADRDIELSLKRFGYAEIILRDERTGKLIAGHGRLDALHRLRETDATPPDGVTEDWKIPVITGWSSQDDNEATAYLVASNRLTELGGWDTEELFETLNSLDDLAGIGYSSEQLDELALSLHDSTPGLLSNPDDVPESNNNEVITSPGDLWKLGEHRLLCGDSTDEKNFKSLMNGKAADLVWTDPPYGVSYIGKTSDALIIANDDLSPTKLSELLSAAFDLCLKYTRQGACWYVSAAGGPLNTVFASVLEARGVYRQQLIWVKHSFATGRHDYHYRHEPIFYGWTPGASHQPPPTRDQDTVWEFDKPRANREHPTMKPVALIEKAINNSSKHGDIVLDPFGGSGSALIASQSADRICYTMEIEPKYCDVICKRYQLATSITPVRNGKEISFV